MEIFFFHRKDIPGAVSIQEGFRPLINELGKYNSVKVYNVPYSGGNPINLIKNILFIRNHSSRNGINHITGDIHYGIIGLIGRKSVLTIHDDYAIIHSRGGALGKMYKWLIWFYLPIKLATAAVCITPSTLEKIKRRYNSSKLQVITHHVIPTEIEFKKKVINKTNPCFLQIGTQKQKNLETTLNVLSGVPCKLIVLKKMTEKQILLAQKRQIEYENKWDLPFNDVVTEYYKSDIVLFPSLYEGLGAPIYEAQAAGRPVITTNREPMRWTAGDGAVLLNDPLDVNEYKNAILKLLNDDDFREDLIKKGKENAKRFSLENSVLSYTNLYKSL